MASTIVCFLHSIQDVRNCGAFASELNEALDHQDHCHHLVVEFLRMYFSPRCVVSNGKQQQLSISFLELVLMTSDVLLEMRQESGQDQHVLNS